MRSLDIAWAAGLLEGEGCFLWHRGYPQISLEMTDRDVVERFARLFPTKRNRHVMSRSNKDYSGEGSPRRDSYRYEVQGQRAVEVMMTVFALMGDRRREKIRSILLEWRDTPYWASPGSDYYAVRYLGGARRPRVTL